jgi:hypothetical protein
VRAIGSSAAFTLERGVGDGLRARPAGDGAKICVLIVIGTLSRFSTVVDARFAFRSDDVVRTQEETCRNTGDPKVIRVD